MQYSFDVWNPLLRPVAPKIPEPEEVFPPETFPFSKDLQELEASLSMNEKTVSEELPSGHWEEWASTVDGMVSRMEAVNAQTRTELDELRRVAEEYRSDNRVMAKQIHQLLSEKEQLSQKLAAYELELARFRPVLGNLHLKV